MNLTLDSQKNNELKNERAQTIKALFAKLDKNERSTDKELKPESKTTNLWSRC